MQRVEGEKAERKVFCKSKAMRKNREILKWKNNMRALAMMVCLALMMQSASGCGTTESAQSTQENATYPGHYGKILFVEFWKPECGT